jgi:CRP/FNR family transcriptional regulator, cyclic AMP receptor protein
MTDPTLHGYLAEHAMFQGLPAEQLDLIASHATMVDVRPQQRIFKHDTRADSFYIVRDGKVGLEVAAIEGEPLVIQTLGEKKVLGWSWLIPPYQWLFDARAVTHARVIALDGERLRAHCDADPNFGYALLRRFAALMAERLNAARLAAMAQYSGA